MKKIVTQMLAESLGLSRVTVWKVLNNRPGVAPETIKRVRSAVEKLHQDNQENADRYEEDDDVFAPLDVDNVTLLASRADTSSFWMRIVDQIASELNQRQIKLNYIPLDASKLAPVDLQTLLQPDKTDGLLVINIYNESTISALQKSSLPKVFFDTIPGHTPADLLGDLILLEGEHTVKTITNSVIKKGCKRIGFIGDIQYAHTNLLRWKGFQEALRSNNLPLDPSVCLVKPIDKDTYREDIESFLSNIQSMPDAFVCASDFVAFITLNLLEKLHYRIPKDLLITGYDDSKEFLLDHHGVSTACVDNALLGTRMVNQLLYRIQNTNSDYEEIKIFPRILFRS